MANPLPLRTTIEQLHSTDVEREALAFALEQSEARCQRLIHRAGYAIYRATPEGRFLDVNPALVAMLGYESEEELYSLDIGRDVYVDPTERDRLRHRLLRSDSVEWGETRWRRKDGSAITVRLSIRSVFDAAGRLDCYEGIAEDITEQRRREELLRRSERMACLGTTLAGVAHELNNPLTAILGFAQLLLRGSLDEESRVALETIDHEAARAGKIVHGLLALARKNEVERQVSVCLNDVTAYITRTRRYALETRGIKCSLELDPDVPMILGDRAELEQVVLNLLNNAEQAIRSVCEEEGGHIWIRTRAESHAVVLEVQDDGPGVPEHARERIWDPFWTTKASGAGTGLGLSVVHGIVVEHGGTIELAETHAGDCPSCRPGARFVVRFPRPSGDASTNRGNGTHARASTRGAAPTLAATPARRALDVLVVQPEAHEVGFLTGFLESRGHAALAAPDIDRAKCLAERMTFDAVVCEASLAEGGPPLQALRSCSGVAGARFVIAAGGPETTARLPLPLPVGATVVMRPYDLEELRLLLED